MENSVESAYGQDCGTYTAILSPAYSFLKLEKTGKTGGPNEHTFWDRLTLFTDDPNDIGEYYVEVKISQEPANGDGYT